MKAYYTELDKKEILIGQKERHLDARQLKDIPIFFVVGRSRSGTTLLRTLFDAHQKVFEPHEMPGLRLFHHLQQYTSSSPL